MKSLYKVIWLLSIQILSCYSLRFFVGTGEQKCLKEEIHKNVVLTGEYEFSEAIGTTASVHVSSSETLTILFQGYRYENPYFI